MKLKWYGTASILLESGETRLLFDPYLHTFAQSAPVPLAEARTANAIFITHPHLDHFGDVDAFSEGRRPVYVHERGIRLARENGLQAACMRAVRADDEIIVGDFSVRAYPALHCRFDAATVLHTLYSPRTWRMLPNTLALLRGAKKFRIRRSDVLAFSVTAEGRTLLLFGSAGMAAGANYPQGADLLIFPYQGRARMDRALQPFLDALRPKAVAIDHFDDAFPPISRQVDARRFIPTVQSRLPGARTLVPAQNIWYDVPTLSPAP